VNHSDSNSHQIKTAWNVDFKHDIW